MQSVSHNLKLKKNIKPNMIMKEVASLNPNGTMKATIMIIAIVIGEGKNDLPKKDKMPHEGKKKGQKKIVVYVDYRI